MHGYDADLPAHIERVLADFLGEAGGRIRQHEPTFGVAVDTLADFVLSGGKRLRPTFAWWAWRAGGGDVASADAEGVLRAAASLELIQACALIHDDLMDSSDSRRGSPTVHVSFARQHVEAGWLGAASRFGTAAAVLIGDLALAWADDMFNSAAVSGAALARARVPWQAMRTEVLAGQYLDMRTQASGDSSAETALRINRLKTAAYTVQRPLHLGAALARADDHLIETLREFGDDLGVAFQLRDDMLGMFGDPAVTGKPAGDDLREGKRTLLVALGAQRAAKAGRDDLGNLLSGALGNPDLTEAEVSTVCEALVEVGATSAVEERIETHLAAAHDALARADVAEPAANKLAELAERATIRNY